MDIEQFIWVVYCVNCFTNIISVNCLWALFGGSHCVDRFRCLSHLDLSRSRLYNDKLWMLGLPSGNLTVCKLESHCFRVTMWAPLVLSWIKYSHISNTIVISTRKPSHCSYKPHIVGKSSCLSNYMGHCQKPPTTRGRDVNVAEILRTLVPALGVQYTYIYINDTHMYLIRFTYDIHIYIYTYYIYILYIYTHTYMINIYIRCVTLYLYIIYICFYIYDIFMN
jgi:hypothetical protein